MPSSPLVHAAPADRAADFAALRLRLRGLERPLPHGARPFGDARVDRCLPAGGLPLGQLHEIAAAGVAAETGVLGAGFCACLLAWIGGTRAIFWIAPLCDLHAPGLLPYGIDPDRIIHVQTRGDDDTLAAMETALRGGAAAAVLGEVGRLGRTASRRLQLACLGRGTTGLVLRRFPWGRPASARGPEREATASVTRWRIAPAPSVLVEREPGPPCWQVALTHARSGLEGAWLMRVESRGEKIDDGRGTTHPLHVVAELADAAPAPAWQPAATA